MWNRKGTKLKSSKIEAYIEHAKGMNSSFHFVLSLAFFLPLNYPSRCSNHLPHPKTIRCLQPPQPPQPTPPKTRQVSTQRSPRRRVRPPARGLTIERLCGNLGHLQPGYCNSNMKNKSNHWNFGASSGFKQTQFGMMYYQCGTSLYSSTKARPLVQHILWDTTIRMTATMK